jgi:hypothetical protein
MLKKFSTKELIFLALMGALLFVVNFALGSWLIIVTGIPGSSILITAITNIFLMTLVTLIIRKFWSLPILYLVYAFLTFPTPLGGAPPGFWPKIGMLVIPVIFFEIAIYALKFKKSGFILGLVLYALSALLYLPVYYFFGMPEFEKMMTIIVPGILVLFTFGLIGMWLGFLVYKKIKNKRIVKQLSS